MVAPGKPLPWEWMVHTRRRYIPPQKGRRKKPEKEYELYLSCSDECRQTLGVTTHRKIVASAEPSLEEMLEDDRGE